MNKQNERQDTKSVGAKTSSTTGAWGETVAQEFLRYKGYTILATNFRTRFGEIDIISSNPPYIIFVEVKTRRNKAFGLPCEAVTRSKQQKILLAAQEWLQQHPSSLQPRFDVIEVYGMAKALSPPSCRHIENAFEGV